MHNYVVSDIHGNCERLRYLLKILKQKHSSGDFVLHIIGDVYDRGKESADICHLLNKNANNINLLLGNHELLFMEFMENPKESFAQWQMNGAFLTMQSFIDEFLPNILNDDIIYNFKKVRDLYVESYKLTQSKINKLFGKNEQNEIQVYISELRNTASSRDMRKIGYYIKSYIKSGYSHLARENRNLVENIAYLLLIDKLCEEYIRFLTAKPYQIVDGKYLLVHSGFVSRNIKENITDSVPANYYRYCESVEDLDFQDIYPMVWSRRYDADKDLRVAPDEKFDGLTIIFGHTITSNFRKNQSLNPIITYDKNGTIASIGIDGKNFDKENGQLNCVCLDDLSLMLITGSNEMGEKAVAKPLSITKTPSLLSKTTAIAFQPS